MLTRLTFSLHLMPPTQRPPSCLWSKSAASCSWAISPFKLTPKSNTTCGLTTHLGTMPEAGLRAFLKLVKMPVQKAWLCLQPMLSSNRIWPMAREKLPKVQVGTLSTTKTTQATTQTSHPSFAQYGQPGQRPCLWLATLTKQWPSCGLSMRLA